MSQVCTVCGMEWGGPYDPCTACGSTVPPVATGEAPADSPGEPPDLIPGVPWVCMHCGLVRPIGGCCPSEPNGIHAIRLETRFDFQPNTYTVPTTDSEADTLKLFQLVHEVKQFEAEIRALREALRPFANYACNPPCGGCHNCVARTALAKGGK